MPAASSNNDVTVIGVTSLEYGPDRLITALALRASIQDVEANASDHRENDQLGAERAVRLSGNRDQDRDNKDCAEQAQRLRRPVAQFLRPRDGRDPDRDRHEQQPGQCGRGGTGDLGECVPGFQANPSVCPDKTMNARALAGRIRL